jgi:hypothetical protein
MVVQVTTTAGCSASMDDAASALGDDGGAESPDSGACPGDVVSGYGPTMYGQSGADDDCKYDVSWTSTPICQGGNVYFTVTATHRTDGSPLEGANPRPDVVLGCTHPSPSHPADPSPEIAPGTYVVGPILFDQAGRWVFRFHFNETCIDLVPDSPHGHAAFFIDVP